MISLLRRPLSARLESRRKRRLESRRVVKRRALHVGWLLPLLCINRLLCVRRLRRRRWLVALRLIPTASRLLLVSAALQLLHTLILLIRLTSALIILSSAVSLFTTALATTAFVDTTTTTAGVSVIVLLISGLIALLLLLAAIIILARIRLLGVYVLLGSGDGRLHEGRLAVLRLPILCQLTGSLDCALHVVIE